MGEGGSEMGEGRWEEFREKEERSCRFVLLLLLPFHFFLNGKGFLRISIQKCIVLHEVARTFFQVLFLSQVNLVRSDTISEVLLMHEACFAEG